MSYLLDTNVLSEARRPRGNPHVKDWVAGVPGRDLYLSVPDPLPAVDALLAATARVHGLTLVTRNVADAARTGVRVLNPFEPV